MASVFGSVVLNNHPFNTSIPTNPGFISMIEDELLKNHQNMSSSVFSLKIVERNKIYDCENSSTGNTRCFYEILVTDQSLPYAFPNLTNTKSYTESIIRYNGEFSRLLFYLNFANRFTDH